MKIIVNILFSSCCFTSLLAQKGNMVEIASLRTQLDTAKSIDFDRSLQISRKGYALSKKQNSTGDLAFFASQLGRAFHLKSAMDSALYYHLIALNLFEKMKDEVQKGLILTEIAKVHRKLENHSKALHYYDLLYEHQVRSGNKEGIAIALNESGVVFEQMGNHQEAQSRFRQSLQIQQERNDSTGTGYAYGFIGYNYLVQKKWTESEKYLLKALHYFEATNDSFALCFNYSYLGQLYSKMKQISKSDLHIEKSRIIAQRMKYSDIEIENYQGLIQNAESKGDYQNALNLQRKMTQLKDSLYNLEKIKNVADINEKYQTEKKEKQILIQQNELTTSNMRIQNRNQWIVGLSILSILVAIIAFLIYRDQRIRIQQQRNENALKLAVQRVEGENMLQEQRLSISRDLHDNIGSQLTFVISSVDTLKHFIGNKDSKVSSRLAMVSDFVKETIVELRDTIWAMNHHHIDMEDLKIRISNFIENATRSVLSLRFVFEDELPENLKPEYDSKTGMNIYRIIQEAINNGIKHGQATQISVRIKEQNEQIIFEVIDNGIGFEIDVAPSGNGLISMQRRAAEIGANLEVTSNENGTSLILSLPNNTNLETT